MPETECPKCHGELNRPLTAPVFQFKGSGWYVNDYAGKSAAASSGSDTPSTTAAPATEAKPAVAAKSDAKPAASTASA